MSKHLHRTTAKREAVLAHQRHVNVLAEVRQWCVTGNQAKDQFPYLLAIPIIYSAWEGYFRIICSICLKRMCTRGLRVDRYASGYATLWLQKESFLETFLRSLFNSMTIGKDTRRINPGRFQALSKFTSDINAWLEKPINHMINFDDLVMTFANVNEEVVRLNCGVIGIDINGVDFSKLDELVGRRNNIAHGGLIQYPTENIVTGLITYVESLLTEFNAKAIIWLKTN